MSITTRISLLFLLIVGAGSWFFIRTEVNEIKRRYREATEEPLVDFATVLASVIAKQSTENILISNDLKNGLLKSSWKAPHAQIYALTKASADIRIYVTDDKGIVLFDSQSGKDQGKDYSNWNDISRTLSGKYGARMSHDPTEGSSGMMYVSAPIINNDKIIGAISVGKPMTSGNIFLAAARKSTLLLGLATFLSVLVIGVLLTFYVTRPITILTNYVKRVSAGYKDAVPVLPANELAALAREFENMRAALDGRKYIENYVQTLTHEIKSPLSGIRSAAEILQEDPPEEDRKRFITNILRESARIENLVHNLLNLASLQNRSGLESKEKFIVEEIISEVIANFSALSETKKIVLVSDIKSCTQISGDRFWIAQAISHIVHNSIEFSSVASQICLNLETNEKQVTIEIKDQGAGIPDYAKNKIIDKFFSLPRPGSNKKSSGLGLALVSEIVKLHNGNLQMDSVLGQGTTVKLSLPI